MSLSDVHYILYLYIHRQIDTHAHTHPPHTANGHEPNKTYSKIINNSRPWCLHSTYSSKYWKITFDGKYYKHFHYVFLKILWKKYEFYTWLSWNLNKIYFYHIFFIGKSTSLLSSVKCEYYIRTKYMFLQSYNAW